VLFWFKKRIIATVHGPHQALPKFLLHAFISKLSNLLSFKVFKCSFFVFPFLPLMQKRNKKKIKAARSLRAAARLAPLQRAAMIIGFNLQVSLFILVKVNATLVAAVPSPRTTCSASVLMNCLLNSNKYVKYISLVKALHLSKCPGNFHYSSIKAKWELLRGWAVYHPRDPFIYYFFG
jgi:hypothetical protein